MKPFVDSHKIAVEPWRLELLELAVAFVHTGERLSLLLDAVDELRPRTPPSPASLVLEEVWPTLIQAHLEAARKLAMRSLSKTIGENDETARLRAHMSERLAAVKNGNGNLRHPVVHGETNLAKALDDDGLWPVLLSQNVTASEFVEFMELGRRYTSQMRDRREKRFRSMTLLALDEADLWHASCAVLMDRHQQGIS